MSRRIVCVVIGSLLPVLAATAQANPVAAATPAVGYTDVLVSAADLPTAIAALPDGRKLVAERAGALRILSAAGVLSATPAITLTTLCTQGERGFLGVAVDPADPTAVFAYYTALIDNVCSNRVVRMTLTGDTISPSSVQVLLDNISSPRSNHNGGDIEFGKDGYLYVSIGDGGLNPTTARNKSVLNGKILRITSTGGIPPSNPFVGAGTQRCNTTGNAAAGVTCQEIFALGLRNPFRFANDMNATGTRFFLNDVGEGTWEEIDELASGADYGWNVREGACATGSTTDCGAPPVGMTNPVFTYGRSDGCVSITGGAFIPVSWPNFSGGSYLYADYVCNTIFRITPAAGGGYTREVFVSGTRSIVHLEMIQDNGEWSLYYLTYDNGGEIHRVTPNQVLAPPVPGQLVPVVPTRVLDTRSGLGGSVGVVRAGTPITLTFPASVVPANAAAVSLNVTSTSAAGPGFVSVYPSGITWPGTSNLNVTVANEIVANAVIARPGVNNSINILTQSSMHVIVDVTGYWLPADTSRSGRFVPLTPNRLLDTRNGTGGFAGRVPANAQVDLQVTGARNVPSTGVSAVALVVTIAEPTRDGFVTVWPTGTPRPNASTLNPGYANDIRSNLAIVPVSASGKVSLFTAAPTQLLADVVGYFTDESAPVSGAGRFVSSTAGRVFDSRLTAFAPRFAPLTDRSIALASAPAGTSGVAFNLTAAGTQTAGYLTAHPAGSSVPLASNVNFDAAGRTRAALALTATASPASVQVFANTGTDVIVDVAGWFTGA